MPFALALLACVAVSAQADQPKLKSKPGRVTLEGLLTADPLPVGYTVTSKELRNRDKEVVGHQLLVAKEGVVAKAIITVEQRAFPTRPHKVAAMKGYVNGTAQAWVKAGLKITKSSIPDIEKVDLDKRVFVDLTLQKPDGGEVLNQIQIFFGKAGYNIQIIGDNPKDFDALTRWARSVKE